MIFQEQKLNGVCDLTLSGNNYEKMACVLDLTTGKMEVQIRPLQGGSLSDISLNVNLDDEITLKNLTLQTPFGGAHAATVKDAHLFSVSPGGCWNGATGLTYLFEDKPKHFNRVGVRFNSPLEFKWGCDWNEIIVSPGYDLFWQVKIADICEVNGRKNTLSIINLKDVPLKTVLLTFSIAVGAPVNVLAETKGGILTLYLNPNKSGAGVRPLFFEGWPRKEIEIVQENFTNLLRLTFEYIEKLEKEPRIQFINAVTSFLEGKSEVSGYTIKLLAAIHFLEWFDGSKTFSANQLVSCLGIGRQEADAVVYLRNGLIHNRRYLGDVVAETYKKLIACGSDRFTNLRKTADEVVVLNYLYSICGEALLLRIGYSGSTQDYIPTGKDS